MQCRGVSSTDVQRATVTACACRHRSGRGSQPSSSLKGNHSPAGLRHHTVWHSSCEVGTKEVPNCVRGSPRGGRAITRRGYHFQRQPPLHPAARFSTAEVSALLRGQQRQRPLAGRDPVGEQNHRKAFDTFHNVEAGHSIGGHQEFWVQVRTWLGLAGRSFSGAYRYM